MSGNRNRWYWKLGRGVIVAIGGGINSANCAFAQITPDSTLPNNSRTRTQENTRIIEGGTQAGSNLFHSFDSFSVPTGSTAQFNNALDIQNIISRVTGKSISNIDGLIKANGTANLFMINPKGIIFGPNASLDIGGSFVASTASSLSFADGTSFSAKVPETTAMLTVSVPVGLQYGQNPASIVNQSQVQSSRDYVTTTVGLKVQSGKTLALVGGNVNLNQGYLSAPSGRVELGGVSGAGTVGLNIDGSNLRLSFPVEVQRADVSLTNGADVDVVSEGGSIAINAKNLELVGGSRLQAGIISGMGSINSQAGNIDINATGETKLTDDSSIATGLSVNSIESPFGPLGNSSDINITTGSFTVR